LRYLFEDCALDPDRRELRRGGGLVAIEPRAFDLLEYLIRNRDRVVSKDDLIASVWNGRIVSDSALTSRINAVRNSVGDTGAAQRLIGTVARKGFRFVGEVREESEPGHKAGTPATHVNKGGGVSRGPGEQPITFCRTKDGVSIALASVGEGSTLVRTAHWVTNIEYDWSSPITGPLLQRLASKRRLVRYDGRGTGLSDRNVPHVSLETYSSDLDAVISALKLDRFSLLGISGGAATAIMYTVQHPERVSKLILYGGYALGRNKRGSAAESQAFLTMMHTPNYWRSFLSLFLPGGTQEEIRQFIDEHRAAVSVEDSKKVRTAVDDIDVVQLLPKVNVPTLVFHCLHDNVVPFEQGRLLASSIPNAKFVSLESENHALLAHEPAWTRFVTEIEAFLADDA
jgi:DNA-binding winged helix-turn-helix (wHTH) protein/pimeloyl-ACP methyl ester carboxylesterase